LAANLPFVASRAFLWLWFKAVTGLLVEELRQVCTFLFAGVIFYGELTHALVFEVLLNPLFLYNPGLFLYSRWCAAGLPIFCEPLHLLT
jgi:hypothetical protein